MKGRLILGGVWTFAFLGFLLLLDSWAQVAQYPTQRGVSFQIGTVPRHRHSGDSDGGGTLQFDAILRDGSTNYGPVAGTTNTHTNLGTLSIAGDSIAGQDRRYATVGGGLTNYAYAEYSTIGGGFSNRMTSGTATAGTIGGGQSNRAGFQATVGGGRNNEARGDNSTIPGGLLNTAEGANAFAAGTQARSVAKGAFTLTDSQLTDLRNDTTDYMLMRFQAGWEVRTPTAVFQNRIQAGSFVGDGAGLTGLSAAELNTFNSSKTFNAVVLASATGANVFSIGAASGVALGGPLRFADGTYQYTATIGAEGQTFAQPKTFTSTVSIRASHISGKGVLNIDGPDYSYMSFETPPAGQSGFFFNQAGAAEWIICKEGATDALWFSEGNSCNANQRLSIEAGGNIGVGVADPGSKLEISGGSVAVVGSGARMGIGTREVASGRAQQASDYLLVGSGVDGATSRGAIRFANSGYAVPSSENTDSDGDKIVVWNTATDKTAIGMDSRAALWFESTGQADGTSGFVFYSGTDGTANEYMRLNGYGRLGIGTASPCSTCAVHVVGNINATGSLRQGAVTSCSTGLTTDADGKIDGCVPSDRRLKQGVKDLGKRVAVIDRLRPVVYRWVKGFRTYERTPRAGFIAQEVLEVFPEAVVPAGRDTLGIDTNAINALLVAEVKDLRRRVAALEGNPPPAPKAPAGSGAGAAAGALAGAVVAAAARKRKAPK